MTLERDHDRTHAPETATPTEHDLAPGRSNRSNQLASPQRPLVSALILRKARDANGVAESADQSVATASTSTGHALPGTLMRKFESSLGADLSNVRVHTGSESQAAADAVGAKAYTLGNDIHFGSGHYDPTSHAGQHLLAHEVAHTVQQNGSVGRKPMFKLEVSQPSDGFEAEADHAADAMVEGAPVSLSSTGGVVARDVDRNPLTHEPTLPPPLYWGDPIDQDIVGSWTGAPQFTKIAVGDLSAEGVEWVNHVQRLKTAFTAVWGTAQGNWAAAVPAFADYKAAAADAESKGLADFGGKGTDIDMDADAADFGGKTSVSDAFAKDGNKIELGNKTFNSSKVSSDLKRQIIDQKQAVTDAQRALDKSDRAIDSSRDSLDSAHKSLEGAVTALSAKKDAANLPVLNAQIDGMKKSAALVGQAIGGMAKAEGSAAGAVAGGGDALQMLNTIVWDQQIAQIESQIQVLQGGIAASDIIGADKVVDIAKNSLKIAARAVTDAIDDYKSKCAAVKKQDALLGALLEKATVQSGGSPQTAAKVRAAVEALPLMQLTLQKCQALLSKCVVVPENDDARAGGGLTGNGQELVTHVGILAQWKLTMTQSCQMWQKRIDTAQGLVAQAH